MAHEDPAGVPLHELVAAVATPEPHQDVPDWVGARVTRCVRCLSEDNHPMLGLLVNMSQPDERVDEWHYDCYALASGEPKVVDLVRQAGAAKGHDLRVFLFGDPDNDVAPGYVDPGIDAANAERAVAATEAALVQAGG